MRISTRSRSVRGALCRPALLGGGLALCGALGIGAAPAAAEATGPQWTVSSVSNPTNFRPGGDQGGDLYTVLVTNTGDAAAGCTKAQYQVEAGVHREHPACPGSSPVVNPDPVTITAELPAGLSPAPGISAENELIGKARDAGPPSDVNFSGDCRADAEKGKVSCTYSGAVVPDDTLTIKFPVDVSADAPSAVTNVVRVAGDGATSAVVETPTTISDAPAGFGLAPGGSTTTLSSLQAGAHPDLTASTAFDTVSGEGATAGNLKDITYDLPPGFAGDLVDTPVCSGTEFLQEECPVPTQIGSTTITLSQTSPTPGSHIEPVYNLAPEPGDVGKLGFEVGGDFFYEGDVSVRAPGEGGADGEPYGLRTTFANATAGGVEVDDISLTVWGVPADPIHDPLRWDGLYASDTPSPESKGGEFGESSTAVRAPFFTNPTSCGTAPLAAEYRVTSWQHPEASESPPPTLMRFGPIEACDRLGMEPSLAAEMTSDNAYAATGLDVTTKIPQTYENAEGLATSTLRREVVTLPEGITVNPSSGAGLQACTEAQYAEEGTQYVAGHGCPNESRLATVKIKTPSLSEEATGSAFLAEPAPFGEAGKNPFSSLLALYLIARIPDRGVLVKAPGEVQADDATGRLVTTFGPTPEFDGIPASEGLPPLPASLITFAFNQGANAPLVTPPTCGSYEAKAELTPYSNPDGAPLQPLIPPFPIDANCPTGNVPPFAPQVTAGTEDNSAGAYSPLYLRISRNDGEQEITGFASRLPVGLTANLTGVPFCSEAAIALAKSPGRTGVEEETDPACPQASEIGHTIAEAGVGSILAQAPGKIYLAGPFEGAPFSVAAITSAHVGPFDLGTVVVHLPLDINPETAQVSIPAGAADQIPHIIKGIVIHVRDIRVYVDRHDFTLNPTSCAPTGLSATVIGSGANFVSSADDDPVTVTDPFQDANCGSLKFEPKFAVSTSGKTSKALGASLSVKLTYPTGALGQDANIARVKVDLPKQLPSRLTTLQKACTAAQFNANPAGCPAASVIGTAKAVTPILPVPLEGPAYFVSHGGEAFPSLEIVLQGYGVKIVLTGTTFISKAGITSSTFKTVPDQPVTSFELTLPEGKYSALAANGNLCTSKLAMPTEFVGQNGATIKGLSTPIGVTGCAKQKVLTRAQKLKAALKACKKKAKGKPRGRCEAAAHKQYGPAKRTKKGAKQKRK